MRKNKEEKRERGRNACDICFQKVIPPTLNLAATSLNLVSGVLKSCQSSDGRQTTLFTEFLKKYACIHL